MIKEFIGLKKMRRLDCGEEKNRYKELKSYGMKIVVDTNIIIDWLRTKEKKTTLYHKYFIDGDKEAVISFITIVELYAGKGMNIDKQKILVENIIERVEILEGTMSTYITAGEIMRKNIIQTEDAIIAAQAVMEEIPLLTLNKKHFR